MDASFLGYIPRSGIAASHGCFWGTARLFSKVAAPFHVPTAVYEGSSFSVCLLMLVIQHLLLSVFLILAVLVNVTWYFVVLTCIYLITNDVEHHISCASWPFLSSLEKYLFRSFAYFKKLSCLFCYCPLIFFFFFFVLWFLIGIVYFNWFWFSPLLFFR